MKIIIFLLFIFITNIVANDLTNLNLLQSKEKAQGCTIPFFKKETTSCSSTKEKPIDNKVKVKLRTILTNLKQYDKKNKIKTNKLIEELNTIRKEFNQYKKKQNKELKKVKKQLYSTKKKLNTHKKELVKVQKKLIKASSKEVVKKRQNILTKVQKKNTTTIHKVIRKMEPLPIVTYNTQWIEITVEDNINIYELALKYYGNKKEYKKIYVANQNIIANDFKIYNGMFLKIPITTLFEEQGILINQ